MKARIFKAPNSFDEFIEFFSEKFKEKEQLDEEFFVGKNYRYFEVDDHGTTFLLAEYSPDDSLREYEKEVLEVSDYALLVRNDLEEYIFLKYNEGTGKVERLKKKRKNLEMAFIKKLERLTYGKLETLDKIFDRSEFVKEFFDLYCITEKFLEKKIKGIPEREDRNLYVKILLNRLMFLWFLQKRGLLDGGDENYLITKFKQVGADKNKEGDEYFNFLKTLFFQGLCVRANERKKEVTDLIGDIPFLNGGLFIESEVEQKYPNISIPNEAFYRPMVYPITKGERNIPVLNLLESKEWTIDERSGDVNQISPEILGYIFEKSINQKDLGAFYTPEEITTYIAKNTIHPYLLDRIKEKTGRAFESMNDLLENADTNTLHILYQELRNIKILDPAVGSGHFLVDAMLVLQKIYEKLKEKGIHNLNPYQIREHIIKNNLYGVDILPGAVEICKLRMFLALAETFTSRLEIQPLPNIDFNFRVGNSLIGYADIEKVNQENLALSGEVINKLSAVLSFIKKYYPEQPLLLRTLNEKLQKLEVLKPKEMFDVRTKLVKLYTSEHNRELATKLRKLLDDLTDAFTNELNRLLYSELRKKVKGLTLEDFGKNNLKAFHWAMEFSEVFENGGFDVVIGNPPYINIRQLSKEHPIQKEILNSHYKTAKGLYDILVIFIERSYNLLKKDGMFCFIVSNKFTVADYGKAIRELILKNTRLNFIIDISTIRVFKEAGVYPIIISFSKLTPKENTTILVGILNNLKELGREYKEINQISFLSEQNYVFSLEISDFERLLIQKIRKNSIPLKDLSTINCGTTGFEYQNWGELIKDRPDKNKKYRKFVITGNIGPFTIYNNKTVRYQGRNLIKPILVYDKRISKGKWELFSSNKIIIRGMATKLTAAIDYEGYALGVSVYTITNPLIEDKIIILLLNSELIDFYYKKKFISKHLAGGYIGYNKGQLEQIPIRIPSDQTPFIILADYLLFLNQYYYDRYESQKKNDPELKERINYFDNLANMLVYELYFKEDLKTDLLSIIKDKLKPVNYDDWVKLEFKDNISYNEKIIKEQLERENIESIEETYSILRGDKEIRDTIAYIKSHPIVVHIEGGETEKLKEILAPESDTEIEKKISEIITDIATGMLDKDEGYRRLKEFIDKKDKK